MFKQNLSPGFNELYRDREAIYRNNLKHFLIPFLSFRLHVTFKNPEKPGHAVTRHFYGNEHSCTLSQLRAGFVPSVRLDKYKGLEDLINLLEKTWRGKWQQATIYMRGADGAPFDKVVRKYKMGKLEDEDSPVISEPIKYLAFHGISEQFKLILKDAGAEAPEMPNFKEEVTKALA